MLKDTPVSSLNVGNDLSLLSDGAILNFGVNRDVTLTHIHNDGIRLNGTKQLQFNDIVAELNSNAAKRAYSEKLLLMGFQREGTPDVLRNIGNDLGFSVQIVDQVSERDTRISSTAIRKAIISSDVAEAARYLGRLFSLDGTVVAGDGKGRILGFPTANISINKSRLVPGDGIYATWAYVDNKKYVSATSIGNKPTFDGISRLIEVYLLDFDGHIYGDTIEIEFSEHIRGQFKFENQEQLIAKMNEDIIKVRDIMSL